MEAVEGRNVSITAGTKFDLPLLVKAPSHSATVGAAVSVPLANAKNGTLNSSTTHTVVLHIYNATQFGNRWRDLGLKPYVDQRQALMVRGVLLDDGAKLQVRFFGLFL